MFEIGGRALSRRSFLGGVSLLAPVGLASGGYDLMRKSARAFVDGTILVGPVLQNAREDGTSMIFEVSSAPKNVHVDFGPTPELGHSTDLKESVVQEGSLIYHVDFPTLLPDTRYHYRLPVCSAHFGHGEKNSSNGLEPRPCSHPRTSWSHPERLPASPGSVTAATA